MSLKQSGYVGRGNFRGRVCGGGTINALGRGMCVPRGGSTLAGERGWPTA